MEKNGAGVHEMRFAIGRIEVKLGAQITCLSPGTATRKDHEEVDVIDGNQNSNEDSSDIGYDSDTEDPCLQQHSK
jgi:hypothetical protein